MSAIRFLVQGDTSEGVKNKNAQRIKQGFIINVNIEINKNR